MVKHLLASLVAVVALFVVVEVAQVVFWLLNEPSDLAWFLASWATILTLFVIPYYAARLVRRILKGNTCVKP